MLTRTLLRLTLLAGLALPLCAFALGVGPLAVHSVLNQNFEADIPLIANNPGELMGLTVRIPRQQDFDQAGVERLDFFSKLRFAVETPAGGPNRIKVSSIEPIREPNFNLLLELVWPRGRLIREFTIQVDPELYTNRYQPPPPPQPVEVSPPAVAPVAAAPRPALDLPPAPPVSFEGGSTYGPVRPGETLMAVASQVRPSTAVSVPQMMSILLAGNPEAFANGNPNLLRRGTTLKVPTAQALGVQGASAPTVAAATSTPPPVETEMAEPSAKAVLPMASPPVAATLEPVTPPSSATSDSPAPSPPLAAPSITSPGEQPSEIVPQAALPQTAAPPAALPQAELSPPSSTAVPSGTAVTPGAAATPDTAATPASTPTGAAPQEQPPAKAASPTPPIKPPQPVVETEASWMTNPVVWVAILLILLAISTIVLLPLLRRPAPAKQAMEPDDYSSAAKSAAEPAVASSGQSQIPESPTRPLMTATGAPTTAAAVPPAPAVAKPESKSVIELLKDIDSGVGDLSPTLGGKGTTPSIDRRIPLPDTEPATMPETRRPAVSPLAVPLAKPEEPSALTKLPSELQMDGLDFDFGDLGLQQTGSQSTDLPPLEIKPTAPGGRRFAGLPAGLDKPEPVTEPASMSSISAILSAQPVDDQTASLATQPTSLADQTFDLDGKPSASLRQDELPPLEMKQVAPDPGIAIGLPASFNKPEPATEPASIGYGQTASRQIKTPSVSDHQFDFADVTQEIGQQASDLSLRLDEDLHNFGDQTLNLGKMEIKSPEERDSTIDYMETKLDLAAAYLDMGDQMGARSLLEEVLLEGDASQKQRATELLKQKG